MKYIHKMVSVTPSMHKASFPSIRYVYAPKNGKVKVLVPHHVLSMQSDIKLFNLPILSAPILDKRNQYCIIASMDENTAYYIYDTYLSNVSEVESERNVDIIELNWMDLGKISQQVNMPTLVISNIWCDTENREEIIDAVYNLAPSKKMEL